MPGTCEMASEPREVTSGIHSPAPSKAPSAGSVPVPSISAAGELPVNFAT